MWGHGYRGGGPRPHIPIGHSLLTIHHAPCRVLTDPVAIRTTPKRKKVPVSEGWDTSVPDAMDPGGRYNREKIRTGFGNRGVWISAAVHDAIIAIASNDEVLSELDSEAKVMRWCIKLGLEEYSREHGGSQQVSSALSLLKLEEINEQSARENALVDALRGHRGTLDPYILSQVKEWAVEAVQTIRNPTIKAEFEQVMGRL